MAPHLRVLAGTSMSSLVPITALVNTAQPIPLVSDRFEGELVVCIKGLENDEEEMYTPYDYFSRPERQGITWSIQVRGRFLLPVSADDVLFGNTFDRPLTLPWGSGAALKFMSYIDPTLEHDLTSQAKPWALSPLVATMPHFVHTRVPHTSVESPLIDGHLAPPSFATASHHSVASSRYGQPDLPSTTLPMFPPMVPIEDDTSQLHLALADLSGSSSGSEYASGSSGADSTLSLASTLSSSPVHTMPYVPAKASTGSAVGKILRRARKGKKKERPGLGLETAAQRRSYFASATHRQGLTFGPEDVLTTDFCYGFLEFSPTLALRIPGGLSFDLMRYWDGQPVRFVCCERKTLDDHEDGGHPWGPLFWCVTIEMGEDGDGDQ